MRGLVLNLPVGSLKCQWEDKVPQFLLLWPREKPEATRQVSPCQLGLTTARDSPSAASFAESLVLRPFTECHCEPGASTGHLRVFPQ